MVKSQIRVRLLPSAVGEDDDRQYSTSFLINDSITIDAGSVGYYGPTERQLKIRHVLLTHSHSDHIASLPILLENTYTPDENCIEVLGSAEVLECLERDVFNDRVWPGLDILSTPERPFVKLTLLESEQTVALDGLRVTPVAVDHTVPTFGFIVEADDAAVVFSGDTGPTERIWELTESVPNLKAVFLETSFPNSMTDLAVASCHLTPEMFGREVEKLPRDVPVVAFHLKPRFREQLVAELDALELPQLEVGTPFKEYAW